MGIAQRMYDLDIGIKVEGIRYDFPHVARGEFENPERNRLTRGANAGNNDGLIYKDGIKEPKRLTLPTVDMELPIYNVLLDAFVNQKRLEVFFIHRKTGTSKVMKRAILSNKPEQLVMDETAESLEISLEFESYIVEDTIKEDQ